jgi:hypothetical protein
MSTQIARHVRFPALPRCARVLSTVALIATAAFLLLAGAASAAGPTWAITSSAMPTGFAPHNERQVVTVNATGGTFTLSFGAQTTPAIHWNALASTVETDLKTLSTIGGAGGSVTVTGGPGDGAGTSPYYVDFAGAFAATNVPQMTVDGTNLTGGAATATVATKADGGTIGTYVITATNVGDAPTDGSTITIADALPFALTATMIRGADAARSVDLACTLSTLTCTDPGPVAPGNALYVELAATITGPISPSLSNTVTVSGGGALESSFTEPTIVSSSPATFGVQSFTAHANNADGSLATQAGGHPYSATTSFVLNTMPVGGTGSVGSAEDVKDLRLDLPPGFIGNPQAVPPCTRAAGCSAQNQVGVVTADITFGLSSLMGLEEDFYTAPVYNLVPPKGVAAAFGFTLPAAKQIDITIMARLRTGGDYGVTTVVSDVSQAEELLSTSLTLWGVPGDPSHDGQRGQACSFFPHEGTGGQCPGHGGQPFTGGVMPFLTNPTHCGSPLPTTLTVDSWQNQGAFASPLPAISPAPTECGLVPFAPDVTIQPTSVAADTPTGLDFDLSVPQDGLSNPSAIAEAHVRNTVVTLPQGMSVNPSGADGLQACSDDQIALSSADPGACPEASQIGTVEVHTPLLNHPLPGAVYLGAPLCDPCGDADAASGHMLRLFIQVSDPQTGIVIKLPGKVSADPHTGQLTATFKDNPQLPFDDLKLHLKVGSRAPLATPDGCGTYTSNSYLTPWSAPFTADSISSSSFNIIECGQMSLFAPTFAAGSTNPVAGSNSTSFTLQVGRRDGQQHIKALTTVLPAGLLANLKGVPQCPDAQANAGSCAATSLIGTVTVAAGSGPNPFYVTGGRAYITGPYKSAPFGLAFVVPAIAGPFNLGNVVVRAALLVDRTDAHVTAVSDDLPSILSGVPVRVRSIAVDVNRPGFMVNPTSCNATQVSDIVQSFEGTSRSEGSRFQVGDCASLVFHPAFSARTQAGGNLHGASLDVSIAQRPGEADIRKVDTQLPLALPSRLVTLQKACPEAQFVANPAGCPVGSDVGVATATTPILNVALTGPAYLVSHGGAAFPDLDIVLQGEGITIVLTGNTDIKHGVTFSRFETVPDAPISAFELNLPAGPGALLAATRNLCALTKTVTARRHVSERLHGRTVYLVKKLRRSVAEPLLMPTTITGQNGTVIHQVTNIAVTRCALPRVKRKGKGPTAKGGQARRG